MKYIAAQEVNSAIEYFTGLVKSKNANIAGAFFVLKYLIKTNYDKISGGDIKSKSPIPIQLLGAVFDSNEIGLEGGFLYPFSLKNELKRSNFYNYKTGLGQIGSRFKDTLDNSLVDHFVDKIGDEDYRFKEDYLENVKKLLEQKIELKHLLVWIYKFSSLEYEEDLSDENGYYFLREKFIEDFNFLEEEISALFKQEDRSIKTSDSEFKGVSFRKGIGNLLNNLDIKIEDSADSPVNVYNSFISKSEIESYIMFNGDSPTKEYLLSSLSIKGQLILYGPPGTAKTYTVLNKIGPDYDEIVSIQFHPGTSYEEFIGGVFVVGDGMNFKKKNGVLLDIVEYAKEYKDKRVLLFIDEINRGNITSILGESIMALDRGTYEVKLINYCPEGKEDYKLSIPDNLHIIATMNSSDRSISIEDKAILRRFFKAKMFVNYDVLERYSECSALGFEVSTFLRNLNQKIYDELKDPDFQIGQAYMMPSILKDHDKFVWNQDVFVHIFNEAIIPLLEEYTVGAKDSLHRILGGQYDTRIYEFDKLLEVIQKGILKND